MKYYTLRGNYKRRFGMDCHHAAPFVDLNRAVRASPPVAIHVSAADPGSVAENEWQGRPDRIVADGKVIPRPDRPDLFRWITIREP
jgi:hypothetical protein